MSNRLNAIMLGRMEMATQHAIDQYEHIGNAVFGRPRYLNSKFKHLNYFISKYPSKNMKNALVHGIEERLKEEIQRSGRAADTIPFMSDERRCRT